MPRQHRSSSKFRLGAEKDCFFIAKTQEFLEDLRSHEFPGREEYENEIEKALRQLQQSLINKQSESVVKFRDDICLKAITACYAIRAYQRTAKMQDSRVGMHNSKDGKDSQ